MIGVVYIDKLGEFLVPVLRGEGPNDRLTILQDGAFPHFQITVSAGLLRSKVPTEMDWQRWPYHFASLFS